MTEKVNDAAYPCQHFVVGQGAISTLNVGSDALVVVAPLVNVGIIDSMEDVLQAIVDCAGMVRPTIIARWTCWRQ